MDRVVVNLDGSMRGASNYEIFAYKLVQNTMQIGEARREPMRSA
jgi:hypothetical protein